ncbi:MULTISPECIES: hypothetical protein [unclassified Streptomyces]|uniref:hypothetical protein n=1 Tax=unclassified Streptomyces TaxID=2593676 RepID=UPI0006B03551|nr:MULTISPECIES: hypothetical protein [unclassified Streptomyces]KOX26009.1 hypothetical protein ADL06_17065 [Streptomyces sp. NRRL F-6491]KOX42439.1 hypothetical protein ADL08_15815 [Streptomyces sp. NRRL F-6492]
MSDEKQPNPNLTPQEQQQANDTTEIHKRYAATNLLENLDEILPFGLGPKGSVFGETSFEGHRLNAMLDLLDSANPADLEQAGEALEKATTALNQAAKDLDTFVRGVDWKGAAATEFQRYGSEVVSYAWGIGKVANAVGAQMKVASTGLASVRNAKPPRDNRLVQKKPEEFALPERTQDNKDYQKALQVEKDRQEAINQMNRLASFYAVSKNVLGAQTLPKPPKAYGAAVPDPAGSVRNGGGSATSRDGSTSRDGGLSREAPGHIGASEDRATQAAPRTGHELDGSEPIREQQTGTKVRIDSVATPPAPTITTTAPTPTAPTNTPNPTGPTLPPPVALGTPPRTGGPRITGTPGGPYGNGRTAVGRSGGPGTSQAVGRSGGPGTSSAVGRAGGPTSSPAVGRSGGPTNSSATGRSGNPTSSPAAGRSGGPMGRAGGPQATGQTAQAGRATPQAGRPGGPGQSATGRAGGGRSNPIVGGTQQRTSTGGVGSRIPKGTVVGADGPAAGRTAAARPSQSGVVGANNGKGAARPAGRGTPSANGVVGSPRGAGTPVGGGRGNQRPPRDEQDRDGSSRPDYLTEDEETWTNRRHGTVPPVIG